jgi:hypothetical protein
MSEDARLPGGRFAEWTNGTYEALKERDASDCAVDGNDDQAIETRRVSEEGLPEAAHASTVPPPPTPRIAPSPVALLASVALAEEPVDESLRPTNPGGEPEPQETKAQAADTRDAAQEGGSVQPVEAPRSFELTEEEARVASVGAAASEPEPMPTASSTGPMLIAAIETSESFEGEAPDDWSRPDLFLEGDARVTSDAPSAVDVLRDPARPQEERPSSGVELARRTPRFVLVGGLAALAVAWVIVFFTPASPSGARSEAAAPASAAASEAPAVAPPLVVVPAPTSATASDVPSIAGASPDASIAAPSSRAPERSPDAPPSRPEHAAAHESAPARTAPSVDPHGEHKLKVEE